MFPINNPTIDSPEHFHKLEKMLLNPFYHYKQALALLEVKKQLTIEPQTIGTRFK